MNHFQSFIQGILRISEPYFSKFGEINKRYANPRIKTTGWVGFALLFLRLYLIFLVLILLYKFITLVR